MATRVLRSRILIFEDQPDDIVYLLYSLVYLMLTYVLARVVLLMVNPN